ncbi:hypothetical protein B0T21DRAFT_351967 [Apiosordaria backusii]|uniref:Uncharacterized protein n=1 Tax=Apiosordaria backusii TaxID=314023 RepID=A0AA40DXB9_9PEZI|nr:hypothetical protein B0T21DRAFT_351967 [Apiosordaria backusii]
MDQRCPQNSSNCGNGFCCPNSFFCELSGAKCLPKGGIDVADNHAGPCPGFDGYIACRKEIGGEVQSSISSKRIANTARHPGGCCPLNFACLEDNCHLTIQIEEKAQLATSTIFTSTNGVTHVWMVTTYSSSVTTTVDRITTQTDPTSTSTTATSGIAAAPGVENLQSADRGLSSSPLIGVIVASATVGFVLLALGVYFIIRRRRGNGGGDEPQDSSGPHSTLELAKNAQPHEMDAEMQTKRELIANNVAWELEDTQYCPELMGTHGVSEVEDIPATRSDDDSPSGGERI